MFGPSHKIRDWKRFEEVLAVLGKYELKAFLSKIRFGSKPALRPESLRKSFEQLGGAFLKIGQLLSLRPDLVPKAYCDEFSKLQDALPLFPASQAKKIIEQELKKPLKTIFSAFEDRPLAAASIGQVHAARLKNGEKVAVKIQRPNIRDPLEADLSILEYVAKTVQKHHPQDLVDLPEIVEEFKHYTENELDYEKEARNIEAIRQYANRIKIPKVYWEYSTEKVLTMEYIEGKPLSHLLSAETSFPRRKIMQTLTLALFEQIFEHGIFHADPHPGNLFLLPKNHLALLDFGIVGHLTQDLQEKIKELFIALIQRDLDALADTLARIGFVPRNVDGNQLQEDLRDTLGKYYNARLEHIHFAELLQHALQTAQRNHLHLPNNFVLLAKCTITLEGLGRRMDPDFNLVKTAKPYVERLIRRRLDPVRLAQKTIQTTQHLARFAQELPTLSHQLTETLTHSDSDIHSVKKDLDVIATEIGTFGSRISLALLTGIFLFAGILLRDDAYLWNGLPLLSFIGYALATLCFLTLLLSNARSTETKLS